MNLLSSWDEHNQRVIERNLRRDLQRKPGDSDSATLLQSSSAFVEIGVLTVPIGIACLVLGAGWQRLVGIPILLVGGLCMWSLGGDVAEVVRRRRSKAS